MKFISLPPPIIIQGVDEFDDLMRQLKCTKAGWENRLALDTETTGLSITEDIPIFWSMSDGKSRWLFTLEHIFSPAFHELYSCKDRVWVMHNAKYDMHMFANVSMPELGGQIADTLVMGHMLDENRQMRGELDLKSQARDFLDIPMKPFTEVFGVRSEGDVVHRLINAPLDLVARYATLDAYATWHLSEVHSRSMLLLDTSTYGLCDNLFDYFVNVEMPFTKTLWRMERRGFCIDTQKLTDMKVPMQGRMKELDRKIKGIAGYPINIRSVVQLQKFFFGSPSEGGMGLTPIAYTDTSKPSTDEETLEVLSKRGIEAATLLLEYRKLDKLVGTYLEGLVGHVDSTGRIHCSLQQVGTVTGRLSSRNPNLQNIPRKGDAGKEIRRAFVSSDGYALGVWDYGQIEMRVMAHMSKDKYMCDAISQGLDLHCFTASRMQNVSYEEALGAKILSDVGSVEDAAKKLSKKASIDVGEALDICDMLNQEPKRVKLLLEARDASKAIGFGIMYGQGPRALADTLNISVEAAKKKIADWFRTFPRVQEYITRIREELIDDPQHSVRTLTGRYRRLMSITSNNNGIRAKAERDAINAPIQGSAADITKMAMLAIDRDPLLGGDCLEGGSLGVRMLLQVHDELIVEAPKDDELCQKIDERVRHIMENPGLALLVPLTAEGGFAPNWAEAK
jgi:DNA polymerase-1